MIGAVLEENDSSWSCFGKRLQIWAGHEIFVSRAHSKKKNQLFEF